MNAFPAELEPQVTALLRQRGDDSAVRAARPVGGGCINHATRLETGQGVYLLKWNRGALPGMFAAEADGLARLASVRAVRVPAVYGYAEATEDRPAFILLEWLEAPGGDAHRIDQETLGRQLAALHQGGVSPRTPLAYGLDRENYIGSTPQLNGWEPDWIRFYREQRLRPQLELAQRNGLLPAARRNRGERVMERLQDWLAGVERRPALLHGDLWAGNVIAGPGGAPALIDPAVYYGDREAELAFTELFGGFTDRFYRAYTETWPLAPGYAERRDLYNLYHLLNHLNLFGEGYGSAVDAILRHYVG